MLYALNLNAVHCGIDPWPGSWWVGVIWWDVGEDA